MDIPAFVLIGYSDTSRVLLLFSCRFRYGRIALYRPILPFIQRCILFHGCIFHLLARSLLPDVFPPAGAAFLRRRTFAHGRALFRLVYFDPLVCFLSLVQTLLQRPSPQRISSQVPNSGQERTLPAILGWSSHALRLLPTHQAGRSPISLYPDPPPLKESYPSTYKFTGRLIVIRPSDRVLCRNLDGIILTAWISPSSLDRTGSQVRLPLEKSTTSPS